MNSEVKAQRYVSCSYNTYAGARYSQWEEDEEDEEDDDEEEEEELEEGQDEEEEEKDDAEDEEPFLWLLPAGTLFYHGCIAPFSTQARLFAQLGSDGRDQLCFGTSAESTISAHILLEHIVKTNEKVARGIPLPRNHLPSDQIHHGYVYVLRSLRPLVLETGYNQSDHSDAAEELRKAHPPRGKLIQQDIPFARWPAGLADVTARKAAMRSMMRTSVGFSLEYNFTAAEATTVKLRRRFEVVPRLTVDIDAWIEAMTVNHPQGLCTHPVISEVQSWHAAAGANNAHAQALPCFAHA
jgi:hypothetical protein